jgi:hypothetical protein
MESIGHEDAMDYFDPQYKVVSVLWPLLYPHW